MTGKVKAWLMEMQEDAQDIEYWEFLDKHGKSNIDVWRDIHDPDHNDTTIDEYMLEGMV